MVNNDGKKGGGGVRCECNESSHANIAISRLVANRADQIASLPFSYQSATLEYYRVDKNRRHLDNERYPLSFVFRNDSFLYTRVSHKKAATFRKSNAWYDDETGEQTADNELFDIFFRWAKAPKRSALELQPARRKQQSRQRVQPVMSGARPLASEPPCILSGTARHSRHPEPTSSTTKRRAIWLFSAATGSGRAYAAVGFKVFRITSTTDFASCRMPRSLLLSQSTRPARTLVCSCDTPSGASRASRH